LLGIYNSKIVGKEEELTYKQDEVSGKNVFVIVFREMKKAKGISS